MNNERIACFATREEVLEFFNLETNREVIFSPHYNLATSHHIPVVRPAQKAEETEIVRLKWGLRGDGEELQGTVSPERAVKGLKDGVFRKGVVPLSGFYLWKKGGKRAGNPFFVRLIEEPFMAVAAVITAKPEKGESGPSCALIETTSNALLLPLSSEIPLTLSQEGVKDWLFSRQPENELLTRAGSAETLSRMTVLRVSERVNDLKNSDPKLIQPLPK
ncbi:MAG: SOS response-associated peptidase family protein [Balneolaceae bacterium]